MRLFVSRFWGFDPILVPAVSFNNRGARDRLIRQAEAGDRMVFATTDNPHVDKDERGKLLGMAEFERTAARLVDLIPVGSAIPPHLLDDSGDMRWPFAVPITRAWRFLDPPRIGPFLGRQLSRATISSFDELNPEDVTKILNLPHTEVLLPETPATIRATRLAGTRERQPDKTAPGQPGPPPSEWSKMVSTEGGPTQTYVMQFGETDIWKIGISKNAGKRLDALNFSVPSELLEAQWVLRWTHTHPDGMSAYRMEQRLHEVLHAFATQNERFRCEEAAIRNAWLAYLSGRI